MKNGGSAPRSGFVTGSVPFETGMLNRGELYVQPQDRRLPKQRTDAAEIQVILDDSIRLGEDGFFPPAAD